MTGAVRYIDGIAQTPTCCDHCGQPLPGDVFRIFVARGIRPVRVADVTLLRANDKYVEVWTAAGMQGLLCDSLTEIEEARPGVWLRLHRKALARASAIERIDTGARCQSTTPRAARIVGVPDPVRISRRAWSHVRPILCRSIT